uniref:Uncharacterized protein n=1 Tax=Romanomermis culicivorax TaxID=13658 RepID=A0A915K8X3_ROMCU
MFDNTFNNFLRRHIVSTVDQTENTPTFRFGVRILIVIEGWGRNARSSTVAYEIDFKIIQNVGANYVKDNNQTNSMVMRQISILNIEFRSLRPEFRSLTPEFRVLNH